jgi:hypothetical protein
LPGRSRPTRLGGDGGPHHLGGGVSNRARPGGTTSFGWRDHQALWFDASAMERRCPGRPDPALQTKGKGGVNLPSGRATKPTPAASSKGGVNLPSGRATKPALAGTTPRGGNGSTSKRHASPRRSTEASRPGRRTPRGARAQVWRRRRAPSGAQNQRRSSAPDPRVGGNRAKLHGTPAAGDEGNGASPRGRTRALLPDALGCPAARPTKTRRGLRVLTTRGASSATAFGRPASRLQ